ncbi:MAG: hypothetical protein ACLS8R_03515 [Anaeromassilibacillus sp.]
MISCPADVFIIGHRGGRSDALQHLPPAANHIENTYFRITLDIGNYREKRKDTLKCSAKDREQGGQVGPQLPSVRDPYERRIIYGGADCRAQRAGAKAKTSTAMW